MKQPKMTMEFIETQQRVRTLVSTEFPKIDFQPETPLSELISLVRSLNEYCLKEEYLAEVDFDKKTNVPFIKITLRDEALE